MGRGRGGGGDYKKEDELSCVALAPYLTHSRPGWGPPLSRGKKLGSSLLPPPPPSLSPAPAPSSAAGSPRGGHPSQQEGRASQGGINSWAGNGELGSLQSWPQDSRRGLLGAPPAPETHCTVLARAKNAPRMQEVTLGQLSYFYDYWLRE